MELCRFNEILAEQCVDPITDPDFNKKLQKTFIAMDVNAFNLMFGSDWQKQ